MTEMEGLLRNKTKPKQHNSAWHTKKEQQLA